MAKHTPGGSSTDTHRWGLMLFIQPRSAKCLIGGHPGLALIGGKGPGLRLFVRKGGQIQFLQLSQGSQICHLLHDNDWCWFSWRRTFLSMRKMWHLPGVGEPAFTVLCALREKGPGVGKPGQCSQGIKCLVRGKLHPDLAHLGTIWGCWCQLGWLRLWLCAAAVPSRSLALNHLQLSSFCGLIFPP